MPVEKKQKLTLVDYPEKGVNTNLDPEIAIEGETQITVSCDSKTCDKQISWILEKSDTSIPDEAFRMLILEFFGGQKAVFCSWDCLRRTMKDYIPPLSPRELASITKNNAKITSEIVDEAAVVGVAEEITASSQPDGYAEEAPTNE